MTMLYSAYGLTFSSELALNELLAAPLGRPVDVKIAFGAVPEAGLPGGTQAGPYLWSRDAEFWLEIPRIARFLVRGGTEIVIDPAPGIDDDSVRVFLLGSIFGALLFQRGYLVMHGNAVRFGDQSMICVGPSGVGKSTLAAGFLGRGYQILADDVVPINADCAALPGIPRIKLWGDSAKQLQVNTAELRKVRPNMEKFNLPVVDGHFDAPVKVRWIYILSSENRADFKIEHIRGMNRFEPLRRNTYRLRYLDGMSMRHEHLQLCGTLAGKIRLARVTRPREGFDLDGLMDRLLTDMAENP
jgi:hypothetical protein